MTPGSRRTQASSSASAAISPPDKMKVAERYFLEAARLDQALVDAFKACAHNDNSQPVRELCGPALPERQAARTHQQTRARVMREAVECVRKHIGLHHHAGPAAGGRVVDGAMFVGRMRANVDRVERPDAGRHCLARQTLRQRSREHLRKDGQIRLPATCSFVPHLDLNRLHKHDLLCLKIHTSEPLRR